MLEETWLRFSWDGNTDLRSTFTSFLEVNIKVDEFFNVSDDGWKRKTIHLALGRIVDSKFKWTSRNWLPIPLHLHCIMADSIWVKLQMGERKDDRESSEDKADLELREEGEMKESSVDDSSQETSGKEGSSSQSSGAKGILTNMVGSR